MLERPSPSLVNMSFFFGNNLVRQAAMTWDGPGPQGYTLMRLDAILLPRVYMKL